MTLEEITNQKQKTMKTKFQIIETPEYTLAVSDEEGKHAEWVYWEKDNERPVKFQREEYLGAKKIIAHQPKGNTPELDLPLLPEMVVEDDVEILAKNFDKSKCKHFRREHTKEEVYDSFEEGFIEGYKAATKVFTEQDLRKALQLGNNIGYNYRLSEENCETPEELSDKEWEEFIQSLNQPKTPKWFVAEIEETPNFERSMGNIQDNYIRRLKTTTINDKTYLVGEYLSE